MQSKHVGLFDSYLMIIDYLIENSIISIFGNNY